MTDTASEREAEASAGKELHLGWALVLISVAQLMVVLDGTIVNIALPYIQSDLDISDANLTWVVTGYALAFGSLLLLGGRLGDLYGRRRVFMIGLAVFAIASGLGGFATNEGTLLAARGLQGLGAALASPAALALITTTFPAGPARNRAFAVYAAMSGAGAAVGLLLGGWLTGLHGVFGLDLEGRGRPRPALPARVREPRRHPRPARCGPRHAGPARPGLRLQPRR
jgi:MFS family permease